MSHKVVEHVASGTECVFLPCVSGALPCCNRRGAGDPGAAAPEVRSHLLHRQQHGGQSDHGGSRQKPDTRHPGAGRQEPLLHRQRL